MRAIVVYESLWGNTERVVREIARELESSMTVDLFDSDAAPPGIRGQGCTQGAALPGL
jgi:flavodoxin